MSTIMSGASSVSSHVTQGLSTVSSVIESGLGAVDPQEMARISVETEKSGASRKHTTFTYVHTLLSYNLKINH